MTDHQFIVELKINSYKNQIDEYYLGHPSRENFKPIISSIIHKDGLVDREKVLELPSYTFTDEEKEILLKRD